MSQSSGSSVGDDERELLLRGLERIGIPQKAEDGNTAALQRERAEALLGFLRELRLWNKRISLVAEEGTDLVRRHVLDSLAPLPLLRELGGLGECADIGSGNGFPALPLLLCEHGMRITMIERSGRKAGFLRNAAALPGTGGRAEVMQEDAVVTARRGRSFPLVISRAFLPFSKAFPILDGLRRQPDGCVVYYGGRRKVLEAELSKLEPEERRRCSIVPVEVPFLDEERHLVIVRVSSPVRPASSF